MNGAPGVAPTQVARAGDAPALPPTSPRIVFEHVSVEFAGQRGPVFHDATIVKLIVKGKAVCLGDFVELKGVQR